MDIDRKTQGKGVLVLKEKGSLYCIFQGNTVQKTNILRYYTVCSYRNNNKWRVWGKPWRFFVTDARRLVIYAHGRRIPELMGNVWIMAEKVSPISVLLCLCVSKDGDIIIPEIFSRYKTVDG